jgi:ABC-type multidrug transport system ATPase subunit
MELAIKNLTKKYPNGILALNNVNLTIEKGLFGLLGPNGAGKSSLMRTIATLQLPDNGEVLFNGMDVMKNSIQYKKTLGYLPQEFGFYPKDKAKDLLNHFTLLKGIQSKSEREKMVEYLLQRVNLWDERNQRIGTFSGGMKQRFGIAQALLCDPKLIIVDEPTAGLDPYERKRFHNLLSEIGEDVVIILSTHIVDDVSNLCSNMAIINRGEIILKQEPRKALEFYSGKVWEKEVLKQDVDSFSKQHYVISSRLFGGENFLKVLSDTNPGEGFETVTPSLEDVYFHNLLKHNQLNS